VSFSLFPTSLRSPSVPALGRRLFPLSTVGAHGERGYAPKHSVCAFFLHPTFRKQAFSAPVRSGYGRERARVRTRWRRLPRAPHSKRPEQRQQQQTTTTMTTALGKFSQRSAETTERRQPAGASRLSTEAVPTWLSPRDEGTETDEREDGGRTRAKAVRIQIRLKSV
jgi:hypothetical protein